MNNFSIFAFFFDISKIQGNHSLGKNETLVPGSCKKEKQGIKKEKPGITGMNFIPGFSHPWATRESDFPVFP